MRGPEFIDWLQRLDADADNLRLAIDWGLEADPETGIRLCVALWLLWRVRWGAELEGWFDRAVAAARELPPPAPEARLARDILVARVCSEAAFTQATWTNRDARALADEGLARARATGDLATISQGLAAAWTARLFAGRPEELLALGEEAVEVAGRAGDPWTQAMAAASLAGALSIGRLRLGRSGPRQIAHGGRHAVRSDERRWVRDGIRGAHPRSHRGCGRADRRGAGGLPGGRHVLRRDRRQPLRAGRSQRPRACRAPRPASSTRRSSILRRTLPRVGALRQSWRHRQPAGGFGFIAVERGETDRAARLLGAAETLRELAGAAMLSYERAEYDAAVARLRASMDARRVRVSPGRPGGRCRSATRWPSRSRVEYGWLGSQQAGMLGP